MIAPPVPHLAQRQNFFAHLTDHMLHFVVAKLLGVRTMAFFVTSKGHCVVIIAHKDKINICCFVDRHTIAHIVMEGSCFQRPQNPQLPEA